MNFFKNSTENKKVENENSTYQFDIIPKELEISDDELINISLKDLNDLLKFSKPEISKIIRARRRTLKNRNYAQSSRNKRVEQKKDVISNNIIICDEISNLIEEYIENDGETNLMTDNDLD